MRPMLLGEMTARVDRRVGVAEPCTVVGWLIGTSGRKHETGTALYGEQGDLCAIARALWIEPRRRSMFKKADPVPHDFDHIRRELAGMLPARVYEEYYLVARDAAKGSILELGTGQGASTVAFALGIRDSGRSARVIAVDQFSQHTQGPHPASRKTHGDETVAINLRAFEAGLRRYDVQDVVDIQVGTTADMAERVTASVEVGLGTYAPVDVLAIDVDGMVDRDLALFYDCIPRRGWLIIDDYADMINEHGTDALKRFRSWDHETVVQKLQELSSFERRRLLGKHLLTYRLVERFRALKLLSKKKVVGQTLFCRKVRDVRFADRWTSGDGEAIERSIVDDFLACLRREGGGGEYNDVSWIQRLRDRFR